MPKAAITAPTDERVDRSAHNRPDQHREQTERHDAHHRPQQREDRCIGSSKTLKWEASPRQARTVMGPTAIVATRRVSRRWFRRDEGGRGACRESNQPSSGGGRIRRAFARRQIPTIQIRWRRGDRCGRGRGRSRILQRHRAPCSNIAVASDRQGADVSR